MLQTINDITDCIVREYHPDGIVLFGSRAGGEAREDSDYDILVIKDSDKKPVDRRIEVEKMVADRMIPLDLLVYTRNELYSLFSIGSPLIAEIFEKGKVMYMRKNTESWIQDAFDDLESARLLLDNNLHKGACYHCQQAVEKSLKALIVEKGVRPERVHDVVSLYNRVKGLGWEMEISVDDAVFLNSIYKGRYPSEEGLLPHGLPDEHDSRRALAAAETIVSAVKAALEKNKA